ncbi:MAG: SMC family ATPase [Actinomycetota bacterium]|jgi:DNA repair exonuclease SbcCD ATPase subunit|nr:SMC family ATPase [Actinomycetota bacterium]
MRIYRISLENYRVFEDRLDLELPSGLVGIYGPNGAGKSYLIESIPWTLYGRTRTSVQDVRTSGSESECVTEVEFEHEDHLYRVSRNISVRGLVKARVWVDNELVSDGVKETNRFIYSTLGMDVDAFRASVFAEQKQLSAFSDASPAERHKLVLSLLGITPLDKARDLARADGRAHLEQLKLARASAPDIGKFLVERDQITTEIKLARDRLDKGRLNAQRLSQQAEAAEAVLKALDSQKTQSERIVAVGKEKRRLFDELTSEVGRLREIGARLNALEAELESSVNTVDNVGELEAKAADLKIALDNTFRIQRSKEELESVVGEFACRSIQELELVAQRALEELEEISRKAGLQRSSVRELELGIASLTANYESTRHSVELMVNLESGSNCPTCGQSMGDGFGDHLSESRTLLREQSAAIQAKQTELGVQRLQLSSTEQLQIELSDRRMSLERGLARASMLKPLVETQAVDGFGLEKLQGDYLTIQANLKAAKVAQANRLQLLGEKRELERVLMEGSHKFDTQKAVEEELGALKQQLAAIGFDAMFYRQQIESAKVARQEAEQAKKELEQDRLCEVQLEGRLERAEALIEQASETQAAIERLEERSALLGRVADYLNEFRRSTVSVLGPRLAATSAALFSELTESEYDRLEVDTGSWQLRISDYGHPHDLGRFSGSERDLANLAFRIAISEQIGHSFGQQVGLLVLDEVFGPLDDQRRSVMLRALDSLKARFNQVIVVTHGVEIKEQMPGAVEVVKLGRRRATARVA